MVNTGADNATGINGNLIPVAGAGPYTWPVTAANAGTGLIKATST